MIPPQYLSKLSSVEYEDIAGSARDDGYYNFDVDDVESQGAREDTTGHGYNQDELDNIFRYVLDANASF